MSKKVYLVATNYGNIETRADSPEAAMAYVAKSGKTVSGIAGSYAPSQTSQFSQPSAPAPAPKPAPQPAAPQPTLAPKPAPTNTTTQVPTVNAGQKQTRTLIDIYGERKDVQADVATYEGDPFTAGTAANKRLNDWWNLHGQSEYPNVQLGQPQAPAGQAPAGRADYSQYTEKDGTIYKGNKPYGEGQTPEQAQAALAADLGIQPHEIDWTQIQKQEATPTEKAEEISTKSKDATAKLNDEWTTKFEDMKKEMDTTYQETQKKQDDILTKMGETANTELLAKFEDMQKGIMESYNKYFDEQTKYLQEMQKQPSSVEQLNKFREEQGLPQMEQILAGIDQTIIDTENLLKNVEDDIRTRTEGLPVSEAAARRLTAMEQAPLSKQLTGLITSRQRAAAGLQAKQATVQQFMGAQAEDISRQKELAQTKLGFAGEKAELGKDIHTQAFDLFSGLQDKMFDINKIRLDMSQSEADYKNQLSQMGFDFFSQMQAEKKAEVAAQAAGELDFIQKQALKEEEFQKELILMQFESQLKAANPQVKKVDNFTDASGNVSVMMTYQDGSSELISLGRIGKGFKPTKGTTPSQNESKEFTRVKQIISQHPGEWGHAADQIDREFGAGTATKYDDYLKGEYAGEEEDTGSKWEKEGTVWQWLETDEAKNLSDEEKASQIRNFGLNPETFGIY